MAVCAVSALLLSPLTGEHFSPPCWIVRWLHVSSTLIPSVCYSGPCCSVHAPQHKAVAWASCAPPLLFVCPQSTYDSLSERTMCINWVIIIIMGCWARGVMVRQRGCVITGSLGCWSSLCSCQMWLGRTAGVCVACWWLRGGYADTCCVPVSAEWTRSKVSGFMRTWRII